MQSQYLKVQKCEEICQHKAIPTIMLTSYIKYLPNLKLDVMSLQYFRQAAINNVIYKEKTWSAIKAGTMLLYHDKRM